MGSEDRAAGAPEAELAAARRDGKSACERWRLRNDSTGFFADGVTSALRNDAGEVIGFGKVMIDIAQRKQFADITDRKQNLREAKMHLEASMNAGQIATWIYYIPTGVMSLVETAVKSGDPFEAQYRICHRTRGVRHWCSTSRSRCRRKRIYAPVRSGAAPSSRPWTRAFAYCSYSSTRPGNQLITATRKPNCGGINSCKS